MNVERDLRHESFKQEMVPFMDMMYGYAVYLTGNREEASDLLQETFLKAFRFFDKFERGTNAKAWLYRIMRNTYINEYRRTKRIPELVEYDEQVSSYQMLPSQARRPDEIEGDVFEDEIAVAIASLPEKFKSVIVLRDVEDLPYEEIAEALSIPIGTVRSRLHRARAILFDRLKEYATDRGYSVGDRFVPRDFALAL
ncbi:MAG TPA: sigma-70 family RNA polymerase sigma factor [Bacteroidota bacterium]|nr:sigma-70 family RNA polymerase sigma factor [Bacteroidota bacterium]